MFTDNEQQTQFNFEMYIIYSTKNLNYNYLRKLILINCFLLNQN